MLRCTRCSSGKSDAARWKDSGRGCNVAWWAVKRPATASCSGHTGAGLAIDAWLSRVTCTLTRDDVPLSGNLGAAASDERTCFCSFTTHRSGVAQSDCNIKTHVPAINPGNKRSATNNKPTAIKQAVNATEAWQQLWRHSFRLLPQHAACILAIKAPLAASGVHGHRGSSCLVPFG